MMSIDEVGIDVVRLTNHLAFISFENHAGRIIRQNIDVAIFVCIELYQKEFKMITCNSIFCRVHATL